MICRRLITSWILYWRRSRGMRSGTSSIASAPPGPAAGPLPHGAAAADRLDAPLLLPVAAVLGRLVVVGAILFGAILFGAILLGAILFRLVGAVVLRALVRAAATLRAVRGLR